jgi:AcrR family transcriptional regulator
MPKQVDHEARRQQIADAVCRLAGGKGLEAVSLRQVAVEAGVSMGLVQHYFTTKDQMLLFAFRTLSKRVERRIGATAAALPHPPTPRSILRALLAEMLPLSEEARAEAPVWTAFLARAVVEPSLVVPLREGSGPMRDFVSGQIREAQQAGEASAEIDPSQEAATLLALVDGLMMHALLDLNPAEAALTTLEYHLDRIFTSDR